MNCFLWAGSDYLFEPAYIGHLMKYSQNLESACMHNAIDINVAVVCTYCFEIW